MPLNCYTLLALLALSAPLAVVAGDPGILADFVVSASANLMNLTGDFFTYTPQMHRRPVSL